MKDIKYLVLSDIHLGHKNNKTLNITNNLRRYFKVNHKLFKKLDIIFLAGDIFDKLLSSNSDEYIEAVQWVTEVAMYCKVNSIKLRILEGTPSHDWKQAKVIDMALEKLHIDIDFKYIQTLHIEKMDDIGLNILYVPDEYKHNSGDTLEEVGELLVKNNLSQVDIAIMHGQFTYQLPILLESSHDENSYLDIVKHYINIGHIHTPSVFKRILAQGSFDRLTHGEEEDKGGIVVTISDDSNFEFIVNDKSKIFKTIDVNGMDNPYEHIVKIIKKLPSDSHVRIRSDRDSGIKAILKELESRYVDIIFKIEYLKDKDDAINSMVIDNSVNIDTFEITKNNIGNLLKKELDKHKLSTYELKVLDEELVTIL